MPANMEDVEYIRRSGLFDADWYLAQYPDVRILDMDPAQHYLQIGWKLRRNPSPKFDTAGYLATHTDVAKAAINPLLHYVKWGEAEGREGPSIPERPSEAAASLSAPQRQRMDGRRLLTQSRNRQHFWYHNHFLEECLDNAHLIPSLPSGVRRLLVIAHDFKLLTGCTRPISHYLNAMVALGGCELTSIELAPDAHASVAWNHIDTHDFVIVNSIAPFLMHDGMIDLMRRCGRRKAAIYLHETEWVFDKFKDDQPERFRQFVGALPDFNVLCVSWMQQKWLRENFNILNSEVVNPVTTLSKPAQKAALQNVLLSETPLRIVMAGTVQPRKGPALFSQVADMAAANGLPWIFRWAGNKHDPDVYMSDRVEWIGNLDSDAMFRFLTEADIFFLSSQDDPFPLCVLEAIQANKRAVVYKKTGVSELFGKPGSSPGVVFNEYTPESAFAALQRVAALRCDAEQFDNINSRLSLTTFVSRMNESIASFAGPSAVAAVPAEADQSVPRIAAIVHLYYHDLWREICSYLRNLDHQPHDLYVTLCNEHSRQALDEIIETIRRTHGHATIIECPNRGMDIGPFVAVMRHISESGKKYDYFVKIHSKKSIAVSGEKEGTKWRNELYEGLLGSRLKIGHILDLFQRDQHVGMVGPRGMLIEKSGNDQKTNSNFNQSKMRELSRRLNLGDHALQFFRGSMFWSRFQPISDAIIKGGLSINDFERGHAPDGSYAHAMERLFACIIRSNGQMLYEFDETMPTTVRPLKGQHSGEDIYIIAAGASCDFIDPSFFDGKCTIGINKVYKRFRCSYIIMKEYLGRDNERAMLESGAVPVISRCYSGNIREGQRQLNTFFIRDRGYYYFDHLENGREKVDLSVIGASGDRINDKLVVSYSTITSAIHFAAYLGARNIVLVGHDCGLLDERATFDGYYGDMRVDSPWKNTEDYEAWLNRIETQTLMVRDKVKEIYGCNVVSLNPFVNFGLEGHRYSRGGPSQDQKMA